MGATVISLWARLTDPSGDHLYALHDATIDARAQERLAQDGDLGLAVANAQSEAMALARADRQWPADWEALGNVQSLLTTPLHPSLIDDAAAQHWTDGMPSLP
jgi:hypothetical protein